ncbi:TIGR01459 family HAD-type hydrolase [Alsobacter soli]|uniref:TIGR01459 family HAD-type hydrolase n=1 Tax=Alsobacter soli TaxID=2109933 RepID=A0A2T1HSF7_9HYPH|nr:TIGR01459 family HAD-type hydrolase [Alsobacter soli]PSC04590.1 TIGR01459 family HAD-type hydrolase [Alsobacter soli]
MNASPALPPILDGVRDWIGQFDLILCDIWGVLHDGLRAHPGAGEALTRFREGGGTVVLVSNAPRPALSVVPHLDQLGVVRSAWDGAVTSGDVTRSMLEERAGAPYYWLGPDRDAPLFRGLSAKQAPLEEAELLVCTGLIDDETETPADYRELLAKAKARDLPFVCANPDLVVERGSDLIYCAGALAEAYEAIGGPTLYAGKPHAPIYKAARDIAASIRKERTPVERILAIGDALRTDVAGANLLGCSSLFVARGIHTHELGIADRPLHEEGLAKLLAGATVRPTAAIDKLVW